MPTTSPAPTSAHDAPPPSALAAVPAGTIDLSAAIASAASLGKEGVEVLERLHAIAKEERVNAARMAFHRAMAAFRAEMPAITKAVAGQHGATRKGSRTVGMYAPLDVITPVLDPIAAKHGFSYRFDREVREGKDYMLCIVTHTEGHSETSRFPAPSDTAAGKTPLQAIASGETYSKRYALIAAFAITCADPDDDGNASGARGGGEVITAEQAANLAALLDEAPEPAAERTRLLRWLDLSSLAEIPAARLSEVTRAVEAKRRKGWKS